MIEVEPFLQSLPEEEQVYATKYLFPVAIINREQLASFFQAIGRTRELPDVPLFEIRVPGKYNPILVGKSDVEGAKKWRDAGCEVELI